jgi:hypothetical protein
VSKSTETLVESVKEQWARTWSMWEEMIHSIPDEEWTSGEIDYLIPARHLVHVTVGEDVFSADTPLDDSDEAKWFGVTAWETAASNLPDKEVALGKLAVFRSTVEARLSQLTDEALLEPEQAHPWTGQTRMSKLLFSLRHTQHHLGEVNAELIRRGIKGIRWQ